jgi:uncharacterized Zn-binding protein involved in type VI secretion
MGATAVVANDRIVGQCPNHMIPSPVGAPIPAPPMPFAAPLKNGLAKTVTIGGKKAAVQGSTGRNAPVHPGLHASDPFAAAKPQEGRVVKGSSTVFFDGKPAAYTGCQVTCCAVPGQLAGTAATVEVAP